jgi:hypothetical protein
MRKLVSLLALHFFFISCSSIKQTAEYTKSPKLKLISSFEIPYHQNFKNTKIGGLSGIDYDAKNELYYLLSDDRAQTNDSRFYTAKIHLNNNQISGVEFLSVNILKNETGENYGNWISSPSTSTDPEDIRYNPKSNSLVWTSEGARIVTPEKLVLQNPAINFMDLNGKHLSKIALPANLEMQKQEKGPRNNGALEGITFDFKYKNIYTNLEEPLFDDDDRARTDKEAFIRLYQFNAKTKKNTAQYAYKLDPIAHEPNPKDAFAVNGVSAIQYFSKNQLLVVERSYSTGIASCTIKIFLCDLKKATNIKNHDSLKNQNFEIASKKLILNMDDLGLFIDNIEGLTFGPKLANGNPSLLFVSDNNFSDKQKTQFFLFELVP